MKSSAMLCSFFLLCAGTLGYGPARAEVILDVGGANQAVSVGAGKALAASFTLDAARTNVKVGAPILCIGCTGSIWLQKNTIGPGSGFADLIDGLAFNASSSSPLFTVASLDSGLYFLILAINGNSSGSALWSGSTQVSTVSLGASRGLDFTASTISPWVPFSNFSVVFGKGLNFTVEADTIDPGPSPVPEPATWTIMVIGFGVTGAAMRRRRFDAAARA